MFYGFLADLIGLVHFSYVAFVVLGQVLIMIGIPLRWRWVRGMRFRVLHLAMILVVALESLGGIMCPLTRWENDLRHSAGQPVEGDSFVANLLNHIMFFSEVPYDHWIYKTGYVSFAAIVLMCFVIAPPRRRSSTANADLDRNFVGAVVLATLGFILVYTAICLDDYQIYKGLDRAAALPVALTGVNFCGLAVLAWSLGGRAKKE